MLEPAVCHGTKICWQIPRESVWERERERERANHIYAFLALRPQPLTFFGLNIASTPSCFAIAIYTKFRDYKFNHCWVIMRKITYTSHSTVTDYLLLYYYYFICAAREAVMWYDICCVCVCARVCCAYVCFFFTLYFTFYIYCE